jgi:FkbM family methyltransferase
MKRFVSNDDIAYDIGAHLGFYTLLLSKLTGENGKVYAFEPNPELLPCLSRTISPYDNVHLLKMALSDSEGTIDLFVPEDASMASLRDWTDGVVGDVHLTKCEMRTLDHLVEEGVIKSPSFIKCDVEGAELTVFRGAAKVLNRHNAPVILFELNSKAAAAFGTTTAAYFEFLESLDQPKYTFFEVTPAGLKELSVGEIEYTNVLALPELVRRGHGEWLPG